MQFLSNGDFVFPFTWPLYGAQQFFMWSYQTGAANPNGIIRMPGRLLDLLIFMLTGNIGFGYFYIFSSLVVVFASFFYFSRKFLQVDAIAPCILGSFFFALNPIFLGNLAKVGLVFAAAMLPVCLTVLRQAYTQRKFRYFLAWVLLLNISLIHPFTFVVNLAISVTYFIYLTSQHRSFVLRNWTKFVLVGAIAILLNAYFILPLASMRTVSKNVLTNTISASPVDYTALVDVSNTGDIFTGLTLSKNVLKDFDFYNQTYQGFYFLGVFIFYALLIGLYLQAERRLSAAEKRLFVTLLASFLVLVLFAAVEFLHVGTIIKLLIQMPGGWAFRSPLKWQLYIPLVLFAMLVMLLNRIPPSARRKAIYAGLIFAFVLMNGYLAVDVYKKILTPRSITNFAGLEHMNLEHKNILFVSTASCMVFEEDHPRLLTELNQILASKNVQFKQIGFDDIDAVNLSSYDYIMDCQGTMRSTFAQHYDFALQQRFADNAFELYANKQPHPYAYATSDVFALANPPTEVADTYDFATKSLGKEFNFVSTASTSQPTIGLQDAFANLSFNDLSGDTFNAIINPIRPGRQTLYIKGNDQKLYYRQAGNKLALSPQEQKDYHAVSTTNGIGQLPLNTTAGQLVRLSYTDPAYAYKNLIPNPSLEQGPWQKQVSDCYAYDDQPEIAMHIDKNDRTDGGQSLQLESSNHIACTGPSDIAVKPGQHYLLSFDYQSVAGQYAGYYVAFDDGGAAASKRLVKTGKQWQTLTQGITVPSDAHKLQLTVYAYPDTSGVGKGIARYDNFRLASTPDLQNRFYLTSRPKGLQTPGKMTFTTVNPTKTDIRIQHAGTPFYLATRESYSPQWQLKLSNHAGLWPLSAKTTTIANTDHVDLNGSMNGWFIDPAQLCQSNTRSCKRNADGTYDIDLAMEFTPQHWFVVGVVVSGTTFIGAIWYFVRDIRRDRRGGRYHRWR